MLLDNNSRSLLVVALALSGFGATLSAASNCAVLSDTEKQALVKYVRGKYKIPDPIALRLSNEEPIAGTCYRRLTFQGTSTVRTWDLSLYLSPDRRFLSDKLYDTTIDPAEEEKRNAEQIMAGLTSSSAAMRGPADAPVTIVEFSDFQCPFCRRFEQIQREALATEASRVRIVFHHLPLSIHSWARTAAEGAACAQLQGSDAFWAVHDQLFENQASLTPENIKSKLVEYAKVSKKLDMQSFQQCMENEMSLGLVLKDMNLASAYQVNGTPTLFINGRRLQGVKDAAELRQLIAEAEKGAASVRASIAVPGH